MSKKPDDLIRWSLTKAAREFAVSVPTMKARLDAVSERPDTDGFYLTAQITKALFTDTRTERARLTKGQADKVELENAQTRQELVPVADVERVWVAWAIGVRNAVRDSDIPTEAKHAVLEAVRTVKPEDYFASDDLLGDEAETLSR